VVAAQVADELDAGAPLAHESVVADHSNLN
jgi:hypothetical protein